MVILSQDKTEIINFDNVKELVMLDTLTEDFDSLDGTIIEAHFTDGSIKKVAHYKDYFQGRKVFNEMFTGYRGSAVYSMPADKEGVK